MNNQTKSIVFKNMFHTSTLLIHYYIHEHPYMFTLIKGDKIEENEVVHINSGYLNIYFLMSLFISSMYCLYFLPIFTYLMALIVVGVYLSALYNTCFTLIRVGSISTYTTDAKAVEQIISALY